MVLVMMCAVLLNQAAGISLCRSSGGWAGTSRRWTPEQRWSRIFASTGELSATTAHHQTTTSHCSSWQHPPTDDPVGRQPLYTNLEDILQLLSKTLAMSIWFGCTATLCIVFGQCFLQGFVRAKQCSSQCVPSLADQARSRRNTFDLSSRPTRSLSST